MWSLFDALGEGQSDMQAGLQKTLAASDWLASRHGKKSPTANWSYSEQQQEEIHILRRQDSRKQKRDQDEAPHAQLLDLRRQDLQVLTRILPSPSKRSRTGTNRNRSQPALHHKYSPPTRLGRHQIIISRSTSHGHPFPHQNHLLTGPSWASQPFPLKHPPQRSSPPRMANRLRHSRICTTY